MSPKPGIYEHYKGGRYRVIGVALHESTHEPLVVYEALYENPVSQLFVRPVGEFCEDVDMGGEKVARFRYVEGV